MAKIIIPAEYGNVLLIAVSLAFLCLLVGFFLGGGARKDAFDYEVLSQFEDEHKKAFGTTAVDKDGYPDMGSGRYSDSDKMSYKEWFKFNFYQRIHSNFLEVVMQAMFFMLVAGIKHPFPATIAGCCYFFARSAALTGKPEHAGSLKG